MENDDATVVNQNTVPPLPNDSVIQSNVSINPEDRLPEETKGQIQEICKNPEIEQKRRVNHQEAMRMNTYSLKNGKFSKNFPTPDFLFEYFDFLDDLEFNSPDEVRQAMVKLTIDNLKRATMQMHIEQEKGGEQDRNLSKLIRETFTMLQVLLNPNALQNLIGNQMNTQINLGTINHLNEDERQTALNIIKNALAGTDAQVGK